MGKKGQIEMADRARSWKETKGRKKQTGKSWPHKRLAKFLPGYR